MGIKVSLDGVNEHGFFKKNVLHGVGIKLGIEGKVEGLFSDGFMQGVGFSYLAKDKFGVWAEYNKDDIVKVYSSSKLVHENSFGRCWLTKTYLSSF
jgi:hypothetical protein